MSNEPKKLNKREAMQQAREAYEESLTMLSRAAYNTAIQSGLTAQAAAQSLHQVEVRSFRNILCTYASEDALRSLLVEGLCANDVSRSRDSIDKKVRGWLSGKYQPTKREDLLELCFVLKLSKEKADAFLAMAGDEGLHYRSPNEIVYAFALDRGISYPEACQMYARIAPEMENVSEAADSFTSLVHDEINACATEEELAAYLKASTAKLGRLHNSAYRQFMDMMEVLEAPGENERRYTTREVMENYLDKKLPSARKGKKLDERKKCILSDWPDEVTLSRMKNRKIDVTRKMLILLFLATDGGDDPIEEYDYDENVDDVNDADFNLTAEEMFESSLLRMNRMLADCGYGQLDPRNAFDWIALYCMRIDDDADMEGLNERLSNVLDILFASTAAETK